MGSEYVLYLLGLKKPYELRTRDYLGVSRVRCKVGFEELAIVVKEVLVNGQCYATIRQFMYVVCMYRRNSCMKQ